MKLKHHKRKGFSLIELMIVIAIIAALAAVGIPSYSVYIQRASLAEAVSVLAEYKTALGVFWSTNGALPETGDTLRSTPSDLPFGSVVTENLPDTISSLQLSSSGNGVLITAVVSASIFSSMSSNNRRLFLGAKPGANHQLLFECGNFDVDATTSLQLGFTNISILPKGCNYNGVGPWLEE